MIHERVDVGFASLSYYVVSLLGSSKRKLKPHDFLPPWLRPAPKAQTAEQMEMILQGWAHANDLNAVR